VIRQHSWRARLAALATAFFLFGAGGVKSVRAYSYETQPIVCDGVNDDACASFVCALPEDGDNDSSSHKAKLARLPVNRIAVAAARLYSPTSRIPLPALPSDPIRCKRPPLPRSAEDRGDPH